MPPGETGGGTGFPELKLEVARDGVRGRGRGRGS